MYPLPFYSIEMPVYTLYTFDTSVWLYMHPVHKDALLQVNDMYIFDMYSLHKVKHSEVIITDSLNVLLFVWRRILYLEF